MKKITLIFLVFLGILISNSVSAQIGGRIKEHRNQRKGKGFLKGKQSAGNADGFARGGSKRSGRKKSGWFMQHSRAGLMSKKNQGGLFSRYRTKGKIYKQNKLDQQNTERARKRVRGSKVFRRKKFF